MPSVGIDRATGLPLSGLDHVRQSVQVIFTTGIGERLMRRTFGSEVPVLLGRKDLTPDVLARFYAAVILAIELWEPRFRIVQVAYPGTTNSEDALRTGRIGLRITGQYRPNALGGDTTSDVVTIDL